MYKNLCIKIGYDEQPLTISRLNSRLTKHFRECLTAVHFKQLIFETYTGGEEHTRLHFCTSLTVTSLTDVTNRHFTALADVTNRHFISLPMFMPSPSLTVFT